MVVRRDSLRAQTDFFSPMTGNTSPRFAGSPKGKYGDEVKSRMAGMGEVRSTRTNPIQAAFVELIKTDDPFTEIDTKKSYVPEEEEGLAEALGGVGDGTSDIGERVEEFLEPITGGGGGNRPNVVTSNPNDRIASMSTQQLVDRDNRMYGNTVPKGSLGSGSKETIKSSPGSAVDTRPRHSPGTSEDQPNVPKFEKPKPPVETTKPKLMGGQGGLPLGTTTQRQGDTVKDGVSVGKIDRGPAVNASGLQQKNVRGSTSFGGTGKDESARPKQTVASLPSDYKSTEAKAFAAAKSYKDSVAKGQAAAKATNTPTKPPAGSFGISDKGKAQAAVNKAQAQKKSSPSTSKSSPSTSKSSPSSASKSSTSTSKSSTGRGGARGGSSGGSGSSSKGGSKSGGSKSGGSTGRGGSRGGSSGGSGSSSKGGTGKGGTKTSRSASKASKSRTGRSRTRCDIRTKVDISVLTNMDLLKDDLADVAYFVKDLQEIN